MTTSVPLRWRLPPPWGRCTHPDFDTAVPFAVYWCDYCEAQTPDPGGGPAYLCSHCGRTFARENSLTGHGHQCPWCRRLGKRVGDHACRNCDSVLTEDWVRRCPGCQRLYDARGHEVQE